jgi:hypothetical protein
MDGVIGGVAVMCLGWVVFVRRVEWGKVRLHDRLIYADVYIGVFAAKVVEVDIRVPGELGLYPYGRTEMTGAVKISYVREGVTQELIESLANLVKWRDQSFRDLRDLWSTLQEQKILVTSIEADFNTELAEAREA